MIKLVIADDHPVFLIGIKMLLSKQRNIKIVGVANDGEEAIKLVKKHNPDIILLDIIMPKKSGIEVVKELRQIQSTTKILMLSSDQNQEHIEALVNLGINGFVSKYSQEHIIINAIDSIHNNVNYYGTDISKLIERIITAKEATDQIFTPRELDIIKLSGSGLQYKEIAKELGISPRTVDTIKNNIFHKLGISSTVELVLYALRKGIITL